MFYTIYKITNIINKKYYIGMHRTKKLEDNYFGSGNALKSAVKKYGKKNFTKEILFVFDNEQDMKKKEKELVIVSENTYNMTEGGHGGFGYINMKGINKGLNNIMNRDIIAKHTCIENAKITRNNNKQFYSSISKTNIKLAIESNKGRKRPNHSLFMKKQSKSFWKKNKEAMRDALSSTFRIISPEGDVFITNRLQEFCEKNNLTYTTLWNTSKTGLTPKKGKCKGWICKIIAQ